ncbi:hemolysin family protein [Reichenbachiella versicolor]|uniref:hemolysin family protein n=1 Tax=Reichenbachiella versicolor TaxID=1821036 RepID=UPI000D6E243C|nr:hemolysin family protein [Reichenbachiella versicolor]
MDMIILFGIVICILFSALFSGIEIAFISTNKLHIELQGKQGGLSSRILAKFSNQPSKFIATTLIGNNLTLVVYGMLMAILLEPWLQQWINNDLLVLLGQTIISTIIVLFTAEYIPKSLFLTNPYGFLMALAIPFLIIYYVLSPVVIVIAASSKFLIKNILRLEYSEDRPVFGLTDLNHYIKNIVVDDSSQESDSQDADIDAKYFNNALDFKTIKVRECMIPRTEIVAVDVNDSIDELKQQFIDSGHSKILVYDESVDDIIGYCHSLAMFKKPDDIKSILTKIIIVPQTASASELLVQLISERKSLALVVDEYGGTSGIVSLEDIIEEIFGEIKDEHDDDDLIEEEITETEFMLSARQEIDYLNETYEWGLPEGEYDTIGGLILTFNENLPEQGQTIEIPGFSFEIILMEDTRIEKVKLTIEPVENTL